jgi:MMP 1-O-methyltransferase
MVFIDGGHSMAAAETDYRCWAPQVMRGGLLAIHDIFPDPKDGGRPPYEIYKLALASGLFEDLGMTKTLGVLRRL